MRGKTGFSLAFLLTELIALKRRIGGRHSRTRACSGLMLSNQRDSERLGAARRSDIGGLIEAYRKMFNLSPTVRRFAPSEASLPLPELLLNR